VNDAFEVSSREYYSFKKMPDKLEAYAGIHLMREIKGLAELISKLERPLTIVMGGLNIDSFMIDQLLTLSDKADDILLTGAWVAHYAKELGEIEKEDWMDRKPSKVFEKNFNKIAKRENIHFPVDVKVYKKYKDGSQKTANVPIDFIKKGLKIGDIGLETIERYAQILKDSKLIIWLGSVGKWWKEGMQEGTLALAGSISRVYSDKIVIGDDLIESLLNLNFDDFHRFSHIHYGDGETIFNFLLQGKVLGVEKLKNAWNI
jgi:phosphoglycerate kinase